MARLLEETWDVQKIDWESWHPVVINVLDYSRDQDIEMHDWLTNDLNAQGDYAIGNNLTYYWFSDAMTALAFKMRFG